MYTVIEERTFQAYHAIQYPDGTWEEPHPHDWLLRVHVCAYELDRVHLVIDFLVLQAMINRTLAPFEGKDINEIPPFSEGISPSTEFLARLFFDTLAAQLHEPRVWLHKVELREAPTSWAIYEAAHPPRYSVPSNKETPA